MAKKTTIKVSDILMLAQLQCTDEEFAASFRISKARWKKLLENDPAVREAVEAGRADGKVSLRRSQFRLAKINASMAIHLGKQYLGQTDKSSLEVSGPNGGPVETQNFDFSKLSDDERKALRETLQRAVGRS